MEKPTKYLLAGATLALLICFVGYMTSIRDNSQLTDLVERCKAETAQAPKGPWLKYQNAPLVCDPVELFQASHPLVGIQKQIAESQASAGRTFENAKILAAAVLVLFSTPAAWYFLLRRIRELRDAFAGK